MGERGCLDMTFPHSPRTEVVKYGATCRYNALPYRFAKEVGLIAIDSEKNNPFAKE